MNSHFTTNPSPTKSATIRARMISRAIRLPCPRDYDRKPA
jgi:hypothetical protein